MNISNIKNIIFDLGGVILNIDFQSTIDAFKEIGVDNPEELYTKHNLSELFEKLELGLIKLSFFRNELRKLSNSNLSDEQIDYAWNAILKDFPIERIELLKDLKSKYNLFLLSNTNEIHMLNYNKNLYDNFGIESLDELFIKTYYSHKVHIRKPNKQIFELVLKENDLVESETLFIDDTIEHIESANKLSIKTYHIKQPYTINDLFNY